MDDSFADVVYEATRETLLLAEGDTDRRRRRAALQATLMSVLRRYTDLGEADADYVVRCTLDNPLIPLEPATISDRARRITAAFLQAVADRNQPFR